MKTLFSITLLFLSFISNAKFIEGKILFNDGHTETGLIKSFLENDLIDFSLNSSLEHSLNLDDKTLKFKLSENSDVKSISINDINEVEFLNEKGASIIYKVILLKDISVKGKIKENARKLFLSLIKKGKINIYGIQYVDQGRVNGVGYYSKDYRFYYQNAKENYAINYYDLDNELVLFSLKSRMTKPLQVLFSDCPEVLNDIDVAVKNFYKEDKNTQKMNKELEKEFKSLPNDKQENLEIIHFYELNNFQKLIDKYENCK